MADEWTQVQKIPTQAFTCGYCGKVIGADKGYLRSHAAGMPQDMICICPVCSRPTYLQGVPGPERQIPGVAYGTDVDHLPTGVKELYAEARNCYSVGAYTSAVLVCRKLLMHIAVEQGAAANQSFVAYVDHLAAIGYVPPNGKAWVDVIRTKANEANHEIQLKVGGDASLLLSFLEMLLKFIYEFPHKVPAAAPPKP